MTLCDEYRSDHGHHQQDGADHHEPSSQQHETKQCAQPDENDPESLHVRRVTLNCEDRVSAV